MPGQAGQPADYTVDDLIAVCIARQVRDGDILAQGLATPLVAAGYVLAQRTHAPNVCLVAGVGPGMIQDWLPLGLARAETLWLDRLVAYSSFVAAAADLLPTYAPKEFFRPAQLDAQGNFNNIAIGKNYRRPRLRLPGTGGIPDVSTYSSEMYLYVPRHSRAVFVPELDWLSGLGHHPARRKGGGPQYLVSDLGQFDWADGRMRLVTVHPGVTVERIQAKTGFELVISPDLHETPPPTPEDLRLLYDEVDPLGVRRLETLAGTARRDHLRAILAQEEALRALASPDD